VSNTACRGAPCLALARHGSQEGPISHKENVAQGRAFCFLDLQFAEAGLESPMGHAIPVIAESAGCHAKDQQPDEVLSQLSSDRSLERSRLPAHPMRKATDGMYQHLFSATLIRAFSTTQFSFYVTNNLDPRCEKRTMDSCAMHRKIISPETPRRGLQPGPAKSLFRNTLRVSCSLTILCS
jgi:hypothetical protein